MVLHKTCYSTGAMTIAPTNVIGHQEVDHPVANRPQLVSTLLDLHARESPNPKGREALAAAVNRMIAVAGVHRQLCRSEPQDAVDIASYPLDPAAALEQGCAGDAQGLRATGGCA
jgi:two-component sensor histidine kinase